MGSSYLQPLKSLSALQEHYNFRAMYHIVYAEDTIIQVSNPLSLFANFFV